MNVQRTVAFSAADLGDLIRSERRALHRTQSWVADRVGVRRATVADLERGKNTSVYTLMAVLSALDKTIALRSTRPEIDHLEGLLDVED